MSKFWNALYSIYLFITAYCSAKCARAHLFGAIGGMIFVARGNTYLSFLLLFDSLNGGKLLDWLGHQSLSLLFFLVFVSKVQATK